jgi:transcriptional regulator with XRE-family HTH domain
MIDSNLVEMRCLTPEELAKLINSLREQRGWSQETLAELAGVSVRTVQRVEKAIPSELDTRWALAKALEWEDIDVFNKSWPFPNVDKIQEEEKRLNETTTLVPLEAGLSGRKLRVFIEGTHAMSIHENTELPDEASIVFAELQDYMKDYLDIYSDLSVVDKVGIDKDFQVAIDKLHAMDIEIGVGIRRMECSNKSWEDKTPVIFLVVHIVVGRSKMFPQSIRLPKQSQLV